MFSRGPLTGGTSADAAMTVIEEPQARLLKECLPNPVVRHKKRCIGTFSLSSMPMDFTTVVERIRSGQPAGFPERANDLTFAQELDALDPVQKLRNDYIYPTRDSLKKRALNGKLPCTDLVPVLRCCLPSRSRSRRRPTRATRAQHGRQHEQ